MNKMTPNEILLYLYISVYSVIFREGSSCSRWEQIKRLTAIHYYRGFHQNPHLRAQGTLRKRRQQERKSQMNGEQGSVIQLSKARMSSQILKQQVKGLQDLHQILFICVIAFSLRFLALLSVRKTGYLSLVPVLGTLFLLVSCWVQLQYDSFFLLYFILPYLVDISFSEACSFLMRGRKRVIQKEVHEEELGRVEGTKLYSRYIV